MATGGSRRELPPVFSHQHRPKPPRRPRTARWFLLGALTLVGVVLWLSPAIVAHSPLLNWIVAKATTGLNGTLIVRSASLGWLSPPVIAGVELCDPENRIALEVPYASADRSLLSLLCNFPDLGRLRIERPTLSVVVREDGSNLEDLLGEALDSSGPPPAKRMNMELDVIDGTVLISQPAARQTWTIQEVQIAVKTTGDRNDPWELQASGVIAEPVSPGRFAVVLKTGISRFEQGASPDALPVEQRPHASRPSGPIEATLHCENVPLAMLAPLARRFVPEIQLAGRLSSSLQWELGSLETVDAMFLEGNLTVEDFVLAAPPLKGDRLRLRQFQATCQVAMDGTQLHIDRVATRSDLGTVSLSGTLALGDLSAGSWIRWLPRQRWLMDAQIDLARLAALLPGTLRIREGTRITSGRLLMSLASRRGPEGTAWDGRIRIGDVTAVRHGQPLLWKQPILVTLAAHEGPQGPIVENLTCDADFLKLRAAGTPEKLNASASFDLKRLADQLTEFLDLGGLQLAGDGRSRFSWDRTPRDEFETTGQLDLRNFQLSLRNRRCWKEETLMATLAATGETDFTMDSRLDTATLLVTAGSETPDRLEVRLTQPVLDFRHGGLWPVEIRSEGDLAQWLPRIGPWITMDGRHLAGSYELTAKLTGSAEAVSLSGAQLTVAGFKMDGPRATADESHLSLTAAGRWDRPSRRLELKSAGLVTDSLSAEASNVVVGFSPEETVELTGSVKCRGNLRRLQAWITDPTAPSSWRLDGSFSGNAEFHQSGQAIAGKVETVIDNLKVVHPSSQTFEEKQVRLVARGSYDSQRRLLRLEQANVSSAALSAAAAGWFGPAGGQPELQLDGQIDYDMQRLSQLLQSFFGEGIYLTGRGSSPVWYRGPLARDSGQGAAAVGWSWADVYGFQVGPGQIRATLSDGLLRIHPLALDVSEGKVQLAAQLQLASAPVELTVEPGLLAQQVRINPRMCAHGLQYVAPVLAGVTAAEGRFSIELDRCKIPLNDPSQGDLAGRMIIHSVQVGPGPLVQELAVVLGRAADHGFAAVPARLARESVVAFEMVDGRVHHRGLELVLPELTIRTYGWVGLDRSLGLVAEMPVPPKWLATNPALASALKDQTIRLPIGGTLQRPRIDRQALEQLNRELLRNATRNVLEDELNKTLRRLLNPQR